TNHLLILISIPSPGPRNKKATKFPGLGKMGLASVSVFSPHTPGQRSFIRNKPPLKECSTRSSLSLPARSIQPKPFFCLATCSSETIASWIGGLPANAYNSEVSAAMAGAMLNSSKLHRCRREKSLRDGQRQSSTRKARWSRLVQRRRQL